MKYKVEWIEKHEKEVEAQNAVIAVGLATDDNAEASFKEISSITASKV